MDTKKVIKTVLIFILVPTVFVGAYYGYKYGKKKYADWVIKKKQENAGKI